MSRPLVPIPLARGAHGAVVAPHHLATAAGLAVLRSGGSAVDAAIATNAALAVVMPNACGLGGDAFWLIWDQASGRELALNGSGRASRHLTPELVQAAGHETMPLRGPLTITVPGAVRSWADAHQRFGRISRDRILAPAIELARDGGPVTERFARAVEASVNVFGALGGVGAGWFEVFRPLGRAWRAGERIRIPALASTLERLAVEGFDDLYDGALGERQAAGLAAAGSPIDLDDLRGHTSTWTEPIAADYRGTRVTTHPPNSQGLVALEILNLLGRFEPPSPETFAGGQGADARWIHLGIEASKLAFADRDRYLTDPDFEHVPVAELIGPSHASQLAARIDERRASRPAAATNPRGGGTIYLAVVDGAGNAVSLIESNYGGFGSGVVDPATGIGYQNRGSYFSLEPSHANRLVPGKRTLHTLMPGMLFRDGRPWVVAGSMGGDAQPQIHAQLVSALVDGGIDVASAVGAPRWFVEPEEHFAPPETVLIEPRFRAGVGEALRAMGHDSREVEAFDSGLGQCHAIELVEGGPQSADGSLAAATDPRSDGLPAVF